MAQAAGEGAPLLHGNPPEGGEFEHFLESSQILLTKSDKTKGVYCTNCRRWCDRLEDGTPVCNSKGKEYHVFSGEITDPSECDGDWLAITSDKLVLTDPQTMKKLKNRKIHWMFDTEDILISAQVFSE